ncbi:Peroxisome biosynthesis protein PAS1 [Elsinoe australis]|uniref:Peroxisome biosynthesis protein PAS1 n=1 Tax=Elsinoe australis TaxID=40998 RepID=A0A2P7YBX9_9PEZI|nr:Peroxisome biosynthesis protein PAS1 [Elsinoe australis]
MTSDSKAAPPPYSGASEYQLVESADDKYDLALNATSQSGGASYYIHLTRTNDTPHLTIHHGTSDSSGPLAALMYDEFSAGRLHTGNPSAIPSDTKVPKQWTTWSQPPLSNFAEFTVGDKSLRWHKSYQTERHLLRPSRRYIQWSLTDVSSIATQAFSSPAPAAAATSEIKEVGSSPERRPPKRQSDGAIGTPLATLSLLAPSKPSVTRPPNGVAGTEIGNLTWEEKGAAAQEVRDAAALVVVALVHRDRQVQAREGMGPTIKVEMVARPHLYGGGMLGESGGGLALPYVTKSHGDHGGAGADCGGSGGGGSGGI